MTVAPAVALDEVEPVLAGAERRVVEQLAVEAEGRRDAVDLARARTRAARAASARSPR
jgi:hypothetical protein